MSLPGRTPGHKDYRCLVLPAFLTKNKVYLKYFVACKADGRQYMSERVFGNYWRELHPRIISGNQRTDLSAALLRQEAHIKKATVQRECYNKRCEESKINFARNRGDLQTFKGRKNF